MLPPSRTETPVAAAPAPTKPGPAARKPAPARTPATPSKPAGKKPGKFRLLWTLAGGTSLTFATFLHLGLLGGAAFWVFHTLREPEKRVDFLPAARPSGGGSERVSVQKRAHQARTAPLDAGLKRVFAEGAISKLTLPPSADSFGKMPGMSSLGTTGGGLGAGLGKGGGFGHGNAPGRGFADGMNPGLGGQSGAVTFFRQEIRARRIAYVIDYSASMRGKREKLMRDELSKSVGQLSPLMQFQLIFFSGPVWFAGDQVRMDENHRSATVTSGGTEYHWEPGDIPGGWEAKGRKPKACWIDARREALETAHRQIHETPLVYGTYWITPLEMALAMDPAPDIVFFMTDGVSASGKDPQAIRAISQRAKSRKTVINTIAMMEPKAEEAMKALAHGTGGQFSIIRKDGSVEIVPPG